MTTEHELRDLLVAEAGAPKRRGAAWDDVVRRGRRHRRVARTRAGLAAGGVAAVAVVAGIILTDLDGERRDVVADDRDRTPPHAAPEVTAPPTTTITIEDGTTTTMGIAVPNAVDLLAVRAGRSPRLAVILPPSDPPSGYDPCLELGPLVDDGLRIVISVVPAAQANAPWVECQASAFSGWATVGLDKPVHTRRVIDGADGQELFVVDEAALLFPTWLPAPFDLDERDEFAGAPPAWTFSYSRDDLYLNVTTGVSDTLACEAEAVEVRGVTGQLCRGERTGFVLEWDEAGSRRQIEMGHVSDGIAPFTLEDVLAVAEGLGRLR